jgi:hypothetical protein
MRSRRCVEPEHILAALMSVADCAAAKAVASLGVAPAIVRQHVVDIWDGPNA